MYVVNKVYNYSTNKSSTDDVKKYYDDLVKKYRNDVVKAHVIGMSLYFAASILIPIILIQLNPGKFKCPSKLGLYVASTGTILGIIWNTTGIFRNQRLAWHKLLHQLQQEEIIEKIKQKNFSLLIRVC